MKKGGGSRTYNDVKTGGDGGSGFKTMSANLIFLRSLKKGAFFFHSQSVSPTRK